jgi:tetratricopeptide (TPR) repeat protein
MNKLRLFISIFLLITTIILSHDDQKDEVIKKVKSITEKGYFTFVKNDFMEASALCHRILSIDSSNNHARYYLAYSAYRLMNIAMVNGFTEEMSNYNEIGKEFATSLFSDDDYKSEAHTIIAAILMMELAIDPSKGLQLSGLIHSHLQRAVSSRPDNPRIYLIQGTMILNTPESFGGGALNALSIFKKSKTLFDKQEEHHLMPSWGKLENLAWLGQTYTRLGEFENAKKIYFEALSIKPDYYWVKNNLLPPVLKKLNENENENK